MLSSNHQTNIPANLITEITGIIMADQIIASRKGSPSSIRPRAAIKSKSPTQIKKAVVQNTTSLNIRLRTRLRARRR